MEVRNLARKLCHDGSYYGKPINHTHHYKEDALNPDGAAQAISAWSYVTIVFLVIIVCCMAQYSRRLRSFISSTGANVFMITFVVFIILGYSASPNAAVFWVSSLVVGFLAGIGFPLYGNKFFFINLPYAGPVLEQVSEENLDDEGISFDAGSRCDSAASQSSLSSLERSSRVRESGTGNAVGEIIIPSNYQLSSQCVPLGAKYPNIQFVIGFLTFSLVTIETSFAIALATEMPCNFCNVEMASSVILIVQKVVQSVVYASLSRKLAGPDRIAQAVLYLQVLGLLNFALWIDSLTFSQYSLALDAAKTKYGEPYKILEVLYEALVADYRLLCCALFIEHAQDIREEFASGQRDDDLSEIGNDESELTVPVIIYSVNEEHYRYLGYGTGFAFVGLELLKNLKHVHKLRLPLSFDVIGLLTDFMICGSVVVFVRNNPAERDGNKEKSIVKFLVACMGAVGLCYFLFRFILDLHWIAGSYSLIKEEAGWDALNCGSKCLSLLFLLALFLHIDEKVVSKNFYSKRNQFLLPMMTVSLFGMFLGSLVEFHESKLSKTVICRTRSSSLATLFTAAPPLYLGFLMHSFAKLYMVSKHARKRNLRLRRYPSEPLRESLLP